MATLATLVFVGAVAPATAASAPIETVTCHEVITHSLIVANDLDCDSTPLIVGANNITLDLGGHTLIGGETVGITSSGYSDVTIQNGTLGADGPALSLASAHNDTVRNIQTRTHFESVTLTGGSQNTVVDSTLSSAQFGGVLILTNEQGDVIRGNTFILSGEGHGVILDHSDSNQLIANTSHGQVLISGNNNQLKFNSVTDVWGDGIDVEGTGNVLSGNVAFANGDQPHPTPPGDGINVHTPGNVLIANTADNNGSYGIEAVPGVVDGGQNEASGNGNPAQCLNVVCSPTAPHVPATPSGLTATPANGAVTLSWQANAATDGVLHYNVYRTDQNFSDPWATTTGTSFTNQSNVANGTRYCYQISATNSTGDSSKSAPVCATPTAPLPSLPGTPSELTVTAANGSVALAWAPNPGTDAVTRYSIYRTDQWFGGAWATTSGTAYTDTFAVVNGTRYCYEITATNAAGESERSQPACATPSGPPTPAPSTPTGLTATGGNGQVALSWQPNQAAEAISQYSVYRSDQWFSGAWALARGTAHTDTFDVTNGTRYCYEITATNPTGESARTAPVCATATAPPNPPPVPPAPSITGHPGSSSTETTAAFTFRDSQAGVRFACSLDGTPFSDCSSPRRYDGLRTGQHTFQVHALDSSGQASGNASYAWTVGLVKGVSKKRKITLGNIRQWVSAAVINRLYSGRQATKLKAFHVSHCAKQRSGRFRCNVSWKRAPYAFAGTATVGSLNTSTGRFRSGFSLFRRNTRTGAKNRINLAY